MVNSSLVSVIIPIYNVESYLDQCVISVINQTYTNIEIIFVDNKSSDSSCNIVKKYLYDKRVKLLSCTKKGASSARNVGINNASGEYICFIDSDDWVSEHYIENLVLGLKKYKVDMFATSCYRYNQRKDRFYDDKCHSFVSFNKFDKKVSFSDIMDNINSFPFVSWGKIYQNKILKQNDISYDENLVIGEDVVFNLEYFLSIPNFSLYIKAEYDYFYRENQQSVVHNVENFISVFDFLNAVKSVLEYCDKSIKYEKQYSNYSINTLAHYLFSYSKFVDCNYYNKFKEYLKSVSNLKEIKIKNKMIIKSTQYLNCFLYNISFGNKLYKKWGKVNNISVETSFFQTILKLSILPSLLTYILFAIIYNMISWFVISKK